MAKTYQNHILILHWDAFAELIVEQLKNARKQVLILTADEATSRMLQETYKEETVDAYRMDFQDFTSLKNVGIQNSAAVLLNFPDDTDKLRYLIHLRKTFGDVRYVVSITNPDLKETFYSTGVHYCISRDEISAKMVSSYLFERDVARFSSDLLSASDTHDELDMQQYRVTADNPVAGKTFKEAFDYLQKNYNALLIGLSRNKQLMKLPGPDTLIEEGDYIILIADGVQARNLSRGFGVQEGLT